jgi:hypothetical protein
MAGKKGMMKVFLEQVTGKKSQKTEVEVPMTATTVGAMATKLGLDLTKRNVSVNGVPATVDTVVEPNAEVAIRIAERPKGS